MPVSESKFEYAKDSNVRMMFAISSLYKKSHQTFPTDTAHMAQVLGFVKSTK